MDQENVLTLLEFSWHVRRESALVFQGQVLRFVDCAPVVAVYFVFSAEIVFVFNVFVGTEIHASLNVSNEDWITGLNDLSLHLHSKVGINAVDDPDAVVVLRWDHGRDTLVRWRANSGTMLERSQLKTLLEKVWIGTDSNLLSVSQEFIASEHVKLINPLEGVDRSGHWTWVLPLGGGCDVVTFAGFEIWYFVTDVHDHPTLSIGVLDHNVIAPSEIAIGGVGPWHLSITLLILAQSLREWQLITGLLGIVVGSLDMIKLHIFVPVADSGFVGVFWTTLQLLDCVLHFCYISKIFKISYKILNIALFFILLLEFGKAVF